MTAGTFVHDYLTAGGRKISKSSGSPGSGPAALPAEYGADAPAASTAAFRRNTGMSS